MTVPFTVTATDSRGFATSQIINIAVQSAVQGMIAGASSTDWTPFMARAGAPGIIRSYDDGFSSTIAAGLSGQVPPGLDLTGIPIFHSMKPGAGTTKSQFQTVMATTPLGSDGNPLEMIFTIQHEASNPAKPFTTTAQKNQLRTDHIAAASAAHSLGFKYGWIDMDFLFQKSASSGDATRIPENFYPGDGIVDYVAVDAYNNGSINNPQRNDSVGYSVGKPLAGESLSHVGGGYVDGGFVPWAQAKQAAGAVTGWMVTEWSSDRQQTAGGTSKAAYLTAGADWWASQGAAGLMVFDDNHSGRTSAVTNEYWGLAAANTAADTSDCYAAWNAIQVKYPN